MKPKMRMLPSWPLLGAFCAAGTLVAVSGCDHLRHWMSKTPAATATVLPASGSEVKGQLKLTEHDGKVVVSGKITGLTPGEHGLHVHEKGNCTAPDASSAGPHFNPTGAQHGGLSGQERHGGDLGNITANAAGIAEFTASVQGVTLEAGPNSLIGRAIVVHASPDDLKTQPSGNSGARVGCGLISKNQ